MFLGSLQHRVRPARRQGDVHGRLTVLVESLPGIHELTAVGDHGAPQEDRPAVRVILQLAAERGPSQAIGFQGVLFVAGDPKLYGGGGTENPRGLRRVLHSRQLHDNSSQALALYQGLRHSQFVHAVAQYRDVLADGVVAQFPQARLTQCRGDPGGFAIEARLVFKIGLDLGEQLFRTFQVLPAAKLDPHGAIQRLHRAPDTLFAQAPAEVVGVSFHALGDDRIGGYLEQEMDAPLQVQPQAHGSQSERGNPVGRSGHEVQRQDVTRAELLDQQVPCAELVFHRIEPDQQGISSPPRAEDFISGHGKRPAGGIGLHLAEFTLILTRYEYRGVVPVDIGKRNQPAADNGDQYQQVLPERIAIHARSGAGAPPSVVSDALDRSLGQYRAHALPLHLDLHVFGHFHRHELVSNAGNAPDHASGGQHFVALGQRGHQRPVRLGALALRAYDHEIHDREDQHHGENHRQHAGAFAALLRPGGRNQYVERHDC